MSVGRLLGIDHGLARIGLAVSDATGTVARELMVIKRKSNREDFERINRVAAEQGVIAIVVGMPYNLDAASDQPGQADKVRNWAARYAETTDLPIMFWDEQLTSQDALELAKRQRRKFKEPIDDLAARLMLQSYLDALRDGLAEPPPGGQP